jgi:hypothetical protein
MAFNTQKRRDFTKKISKRTDDNQTLNLEYKPHIYTSEEQVNFETEFTEAGGTSKDKLVKLVEYLCKILVAADWEDNDGPIPIEPEAMMTRVSYTDLMLAFQMVAESKTGSKV